METICLIIPPSIFLLDERVFVNLGILKLAAMLETQGYAVEVVDLSGISNFEEAVKAHAQTSKATWYGVTATTPQIPQVVRVVRSIREVSKAKIVVGGPHPTLVSAAYKREKKLGIAGRATKALAQMQEMFDSVVAGDGEFALLEVLKTGAPFVDGDDPKGPLFMTNKVYEDTPMPARRLVDLESYKYTIDGVRATSLIAQLGCPFECGFCGGRDSAMLRRIRTRSTQSILDEIKYLYKTYGFTGFMFYDDELNVSKSLVELMNGIAVTARSLGTEFRLRGFVKSELFTDAQAEAMYRAGFRWLLTGFESGSPRILNNINKKATLEDNDRCMEIAHRHGLKVKALMSIGHPGESEATVLETRDWLLRVKPEDFDVTIITTYPGTPYYDHAVETAPGIWTYTCPRTKDQLHAIAIDYNETADYYKGDPDGGYKAYVYTDQLTSEGLVTLRNAVEAQVRKELNIPFNRGVPATRFEHSMGQMGPLPSNILRMSANANG